MAEKRISPRVDLSAEVEIKLDDKSIKVKLNNISNKGMAFVSEKNLAAGTYYFLNFALPSGDTIDNAKIKIIRADKISTGYFIAITFINITEKSKQGINKYVANLK